MVVRAGLTHASGKTPRQLNASTTTVRCDVMAHDMTGNTEVFGGFEEDRRRKRERGEEERSRARWDGDRVCGYLIDRPSKHATSTRGQMHLGRSRPPTWLRLNRENMLATLRRDARAPPPWAGCPTPCRAMWVCVCSGVISTHPKPVVDGMELVQKT